LIYAQIVNRFIELAPRPTRSPFRHVAEEDSMERHIGVTGQSILAHCVTTQTKCWPILLLTIVTLTVYSAIGITLSSVSLCPSVRPSVTLCTVALGVGVGVESCAIVFLGWYFSFTSSDTFAVRLFTFQRFIHCCRM